MFSSSIHTNGPNLQGMYYNNIARAHTSSDLTSPLLNAPIHPSQSFDNGTFDPNLNQHHNNRKNHDNFEALIPKMTILPQWGPYIFPNDVLYTTATTKSTTPPTSKSSPPPTTQLDINLSPPSTSSASNSVDTNDSCVIIPPGWCSVKLFGKERLIAPSVVLFQDPDAISLQVIKSMMNPSHLPTDILSSESQDIVRLGQSQLLPQQSKMPSDCELEIASGNLIKNQLESSKTKKSTTFPHPSSQSSNVNLYVSSKPRQNLFTSEPMVLAPTSMTFQQDGYTTTLLSSPPNNYNTDNNSYNQHYNHKQPSNSAQIAILAESAACSSKSTTLPKDGFLFSDDNIVHSFLPHHTSAHLKANSIHQLPLNYTMSSSQNQQDQQNCQQKRYYQTVSSRPMTQQNLPDDLMGFGDMVNPGGNMGTESMWVTPLSMIATDAYRRLSIPTTHFNTKLERKFSGCCHRTALPGWIAKICSAFIDIHLDVPTIRPNRDFDSFQQSMVDMIYHYRSQLTLMDGGSMSNSSENQWVRVNNNNYPHLAEKLAKINPQLSHLITKNLISSIKTAFSTPITLNRVIPKAALDLIHNSKNNQFEANKVRLEMLAQSVIDSTPYSKKTRNLTPLDISSYTHPSAVNPTHNSSNHHDKESTQYGLLAKLGVYHTQPIVSIFGNNHTSQFLFSGDDDKVKIWPFNSTALFRKISITMLKPTPRISLAQFFGGCFKCIKTPTNMIQILNSHQLSYNFSFPTELITHYKSMYKTHTGLDMISNSINDDLVLQVDNAANFHPNFTRTLDYPKVRELIPYLEFLYSTPLFYQINPRSMYQLIACVRDQIVLDWTERSGYLVKDYDSYGLFTALIRWSVFWESKRYISHIQVCPILKQLKGEYLSIIKYSLTQFQSQQNSYLNQLNDYVEIMNGGNDTNKVGIREVNDKHNKNIKLSLPLPLPPQFVLEIPPNLISKYLSINHFIHTINPCEICYLYRDVRIVNKPWVQPVEGKNGSTDNNNPSAPLPTSVFDLNFFNIPLFDGFSNSSSQNHNNHSTRFDLASGKAHDIMGQALSLSPETLRQLNIPIQTWSSILNPHDNHHHNNVTRAENIPFTAIYSTQTNDFQPINHSFVSGSTSHHHLSTIPNPHQEYKVLTNSITKNQSVNNAYGIYIPSNLVRRAIGPLIALFPTISFTSEQLASLFAQPSIFTDYEQHFILSAREITFISTYIDDGMTTRIRNEPETNQTLARKAMTNSKAQGPWRESGAIASNKWYTMPSPNAYTCLLLDTHIPTSQQMIALRDFEQAKMKFAQLQNEHFSESSLQCYLNILDQSLYERYQQRQSIEHQYKLGIKDNSHENSSNIRKQSYPTTTISPSSKELQLHLTSALDQYHHNLHESLSNQLGYRDGVYGFFIRDEGDTIDDDKGRMKDQVGDPTLSKFTLSNGNSFHRVLFNSEYISAATRHTNYTLAFPRSRFLGYSEPFFKFQQWIQGEYLLSTQKYTKMSILNDTLFYPYIEMQRSVNSYGDGNNNYLPGNNHTSPQTHNSIINTYNTIIDIPQKSSPFVSIEQYYTPASIYNDNDEVSIDLQPQNWEDIDLNTTNPNPRAPTKSSLSNHTPSLQSHSGVNIATSHFIHQIYRKKGDNDDSTSIFNQECQSNHQPPQLSKYYYTPTTSSSISAPVVITGVTPILHSMNKFSQTVLSPSDFATKYQIHTFLPSLLPIWNFLFASNIGFLCGFVLFVMFGLILQGKVEPTPSTLICMPILAVITFLFPFLITLQQHLHESVRHQSICGFSQCCGVPAQYIQIQRTCWEKRRIEQACHLATFGTNSRSSTMPSASRFLISFWFSWTLISVYCRWTSLYPLTLTQIFVPSYVFLGGAVFTFCHRLGTPGLLQAIPALALLISCGVLHGALVSPDNHHYNALAISAPFLLFIVIGIIGMIWFAFSIVGDEDDGWDCSSCDCSCGCCVGINLILFGTMVWLLWIVFMLLLLQKIVRPDTWWSTSYWASNFLTYSLIICIFAMIWLHDDEDSGVPTISGLKTHPVDHLDIQGFGVAPHSHCEINRV